MKHYKQLNIICLIQLIIILNTATIKADTIPHKWSLEECVNYAITYNLDIKVQSDNCQITDIALHDFKNSRLPTFNSELTQQFNFGRSLNSENTYINTNTNQSSFVLNAELPLFTGFKISNQIKMGKLQLQSETEKLKKIKNDIYLDVLNAFFQIIYDKGVVDIARRQIEIDSLQVLRLSMLFSNGKISYASISKQKATLANSQLALVESSNKLHLSILSLTQIMELDSPNGFDIKLPDFSNAQLPLPDLNLVYSEALRYRPEILSEMYLVEYAQKNVELQKSGLYPQLSFLAGIGTNYYKTNGYENEPLWKQMKNNFSQELGLRLTIPIFNRFSTCKNIKKAKVSMEKEKLSLASIKKTIFKEIQQVYYDIINAKSKFEASNAACISSLDAFKFEKVKYECGKANSTEFNESKNQYLESESKLLQAKYEYMYKLYILDYYRGGKFAL